MDWFKFAPVIVQALIETVQAVEIVFGPGTGEEKKKAVMEIIEALVTGFSIANKDNIIRWAGVMIDIIVAFYNLTGKFGKGK